MYSIITDTSANLDCELLHKHNIISIPFSFYIDGKEQTCTDTVAFDGSAYYNAMRKGTKVTTSQVNPQRYIDYMLPILKDGRDILFVGMSSGISGSYCSAQMAASQLLDEFPDRSIFLVDTLGASLGEGLLVLKAAECRDNGMGLKETADFLSGLRYSMCQVFTVDDLKYLKTTGRLSNIMAIAGTILNIKPILKGNESGKIVCFSKVRGRKQSIKALAEQYDAMVLHPEEQTVGIAHADCPEDAECLAGLLRKNNPPKEIMNVCYEPVTGSHVGPGTLALFFFGNTDFRTQS